MEEFVSPNFRCSTPLLSWVLSSVLIEKYCHDLCLFAAVRQGIKLCECHWSLRFLHTWTLYCSITFSSTKATLMKLVFPGSLSLWGDFWINFSYSDSQVLTEIFLYEIHFKMLHMPPSVPNPFTSQWLRVPGDWTRYTTLNFHVFLLFIYYRLSPPVDLLVLIDSQPKSHEKHSDHAVCQRWDRLYYYNISSESKL